MQVSQAQRLANAIARYVAEKEMRPKHAEDPETLADDIERLLIELIDRRIAAANGES